ncbi:hypothetical protein Esti_002094 [Eimeria stiedai]
MPFSSSESRPRASKGIASESSQRETVDLQESTSTASALGSCVSHPSPCALAAAPMWGVPGKGGLTAEEETHVQVSPLLTDFYQLTMAYSYWKQGKQHQECVFEASFRRPPFHGSFAVLGGVNEVVRGTMHFKLEARHVDFIKKQLPSAEPAFFEYLKTLSGSQISIRDASFALFFHLFMTITRPCFCFFAFSLMTIRPIEATRFFQKDVFSMSCSFSIKEGTLVFPKIPILQVLGPLGLCQLLETVVLNTLGFATLVATNAARHRLAVGWNKKLLEFGARRAQGPDGALSASRYAYLGSFDGTSNVQASYCFGIPLSGTMAHSFVSSFSSFTDLKETPSALGPGFPQVVRIKKYLFFIEKVHVYLVQCQLRFTDRAYSYLYAFLYISGLRVLLARIKIFDLWRDKKLDQMVKDGELAAFTAYAMTFPQSFLALVDTYNTLNSGIPNFLTVALAMFERGHQPKARALFKECEAAFGYPFSAMKIVVSNDLNEAAITALNDEGHEADVFGIGTNVVTCQSQPALGLVYKLVELDGQPCMKLSDDVEKTSLPTAKSAFRLYSKAGVPVLDLMQSAAMPPPTIGRQLFCKHLYDDQKRCFIIPCEVEELLILLLEKGRLATPLESIETCRNRCIHQLQHFRADHLRLHAPTEYKVSTSEEYYRFFHEMWNATAPIQLID